MPSIWSECVVQMCDILWLTLTVNFEQIIYSILHEQRNTGNEKENDKILFFNSRFANIRRKYSKSCSLYLGIFHEEGASMLFKLLSNVAQQKHIKEG